MLDELRQAAALLSAASRGHPGDVQRDRRPGRPGTARRPSYWARHARGTVRFAAMIGGLHQHGVTTVGRSAPAGRSPPWDGTAWPGRPPARAFVPLMPRRGEDSPRRLAVALAEVFVRGVGVDWAAWFAGSGARVADLPTYPFQRDRYWLAADRSRPEPDEPRETEAGESETESGASESAPKQSLAERLSSSPEQERADALLELVRAKAAAVLGHSDADSVDEEQPLFEAGFNSLMAIELRDHLSKATGLDLPPTFLFDYPAPVDVADFLEEELFS